MKTNQHDEYLFKTRVFHLWAKNKSTLGLCVYHKSKARKINSLLGKYYDCAIGRFDEPVFYGPNEEIVKALKAAKMIPQTWSLPRENNYSGGGT